VGVFAVEAHALIDVYRKLLKEWNVREDKGQRGGLETHQHHLESLVARYLTASTHTDKAYRLLGELNYCVEFFGR
jgi:hypothetical protein